MELTSEDQFFKLKKLKKLLPTFFIGKYRSEIDRREIR